MLERIKKKLDRTECVLDLIELSAEMFLLRSMVFHKSHQSSLCSHCFADIGPQASNAGAE